MDLCIDTEKEIQIGLGMFFPPIVVERGEALVDIKVMDYLSLEINDTIRVW